MADVLHSTLTGTDSHEPKGAASASANQTYVSNGAGSGTWTEPELKGASTAAIGTIPVADGVGGAIWAGALPLTTYRWDDLRVSLQVSDQGSLTAPDSIALFNDGAGSQGIFGLGFSSTTEEEVSFSVQLPHGYVVGTNLRPHIHWMTPDANAGNVVWGFEYAVFNIGVANSGVSVNTTATDAAPASAWNEQVISFSEINGTDIVESTVIMCRLYRDATNGADTYGSDAVGMSFDIHYQVDDLGSLAEFGD